MLSSSKISSTSLFLLFPRQALKAYLPGPITGEGARGWWRLWVQQGAGGPSPRSQACEPSWAGPGRATDGGRGQPQPGHPRALLGRQPLGQDRRGPGQGSPGGSSHPRRPLPAWEHGHPAPGLAPRLRLLPRHCLPALERGAQGFLLMGDLCWGKKKKRVNSIHLLSKLENATNNDHAA